MASTPPADRVKRFARALGPELEQMIGLMQSRIAGHDDVVFDKVARSVLYSKEGRVLWRAHYELIGRYSRDLGVFRWWWVGRSPGAPESKMDTAYGEAQRLELQALLDKQMVLESVEDAHHMSRLAAHLAGADGVLDLEEVREGDDLTLAFYALFDAWHGSQRPKSPSWSVSRTMPPPVSIPPAPSVPKQLQPLSPALPQSMKSVREPARALLQDLVAPLHEALIAAKHEGFRQALAVINVETHGDKARFYIQLVVQNSRGDLESVASSRGALDAVARLISADARSGNGRWRSLAIRFSREAAGGMAIEQVTIT